MAKDGVALPLSSHDDLSLALAGADRAFVQAEAPEEKRIATLLALKAIYDFLRSAGLRSAALNNLSMALQDIERGHSPVLFAPSIQNRPKDEARRFILKATAAAAMQFHMDAGKTKAEASALVARSLKWPGVNSGTIARWRDKFSGHSAEEGSDIYKFVLEEAQAQYSTPSLRASQTMKALKRLAKNLDKPPS
jgi:hypothetical protein